MEFNTTMSDFKDDREINLYSSYEITEELILRLNEQDALKFITPEQKNSLYKALWCRDEP